MKNSFRLLLTLVFVAAASLHAQVPDNSSLSGDYYFVHLLLTGPGTPDEAATLGGTMTFDGNGGYTFQGQLAEGAGVPAASGGAGFYQVDSNGFVVLDNPVDSGLEINGRIGIGGSVIQGASTEATDGTYDFFAAIPAGEGISEATLSGEYTAASLSFANGSAFSAASALIGLTADGAGNFTAGSVVGHASDDGDANVAQALAGATYALNGDGTGTATLGAAASLFAGDRDIFVSAGGNLILGYSTDADLRGIFLGIKNLGTNSTEDSWRGNFWMTEVITVPGTTHSSAAGALRSNRDGSAVISQRIRADLAPVNFSGINFYAIESDSTGFLAPFPPPAGAINMAIGAPMGARAEAFVGAQVDTPGIATLQHGIFFGIRVPSLSGDGIFLDPLGIISGASFAPTTFPLSGGAIVSLFGSFGPDGIRRVATTIPLPTELEGISVTVNGTPAPLFFVSTGQINMQVPFGVSAALALGDGGSRDILGPSAEVIVNSDGTPSNAVEVPVAAASPGIFSVDQNGLGIGTITDQNFRQITPSNPASPGQLVFVFLTGLGGVDPAVADGAAAPREPLSETTELVEVLFAGESGRIIFSGLAPDFAGLYQVNVFISDSVAPDPAVPVAIATTDSLSDLVEIPVEF